MGGLVAGSVGKVVAEAFSVVSGLAHQRKNRFFAIQKILKH